MPAVSIQQILMQTAAGNVSNYQQCGYFHITMDGYLIRQDRLILSRVIPTDESSVNVKEEAKRGNILDEMNASYGRGCGEELHLVNWFRADEWNRRYNKNHDESWNSDRTKLGDKLKRLGKLKQILLCTKVATIPQNTRMDLQSDSESGWNPVSGRKTAVRRTHIEIRVLCHPRCKSTGTYYQKEACLSSSAGYAYRRLQAEICRT